MKTKLILFLMLIIGQSCNQSSSIVEVVDYNSKKQKIKSSILNYNSTVKSFGSASYFSKSPSNSLYQVAQTQISKQFPGDNIFPISEEVESELNSNSSTLSAKYQIRRQLLIEKISETMMININKSNISNFRIKDISDSISMDSVNLFFDEFKSNLMNDIDAEEAEIDTDETLTEDEKLAIVAANFAIRESLNQMVDEVVEYMEDEEPAFEHGRTSGLFRRTVNWFKRTANLAVTIVARAVPAAYVGAFVGLLWGPTGAAVGGTFGAIFGAMEGLDCYTALKTNCITCLFCQPDSSKPCYAVDC